MLTRAGSALALRYVVFAVLATIANLGVQRLVLGATGDGHAGLLAALVAGTLAGLVLKYILDKKWIFDDRSSGVKAHGQRFGLYTVMGLATTVIFWASEAAAWYVGGTQAWREAGALAGLAVGYVVKYQLDRRFVFTAPGTERAA